MNQLAHSAARGAPAPTRRRGSRSLVFLAVTALLATLAAVGGSVTPAGAATVTSQASLSLTCTANAPVVGAQTVTQELTIDIEHPDEVPRNSTETVTISQPPLTVPAELASGGSTYPIINLAGISVAFKVSSQFRVDAIRTVGGTTAATATATPAGDILFQVPGPLLGGQTYTLPTVEVDVRAVGTVGTVGTVSFQSFNVTARAELPLIGAQNIPTSCPTPSPNPPLLSIGVGAGSFSTDPEPVITTTNFDQLTKARYGSTNVPGGATDMTSNPFSVTTISVPDIKPGTSTNMSLLVSATNWMEPYSSGHVTERREIDGLQNWAMTFNGPNPSVFTVTSVTSANPAAMTASYNAATNVITLARPTGSAGQLGNGPFAPPEVTVAVQAVGSGPYPQTASLSFRDVRFQPYQRTCSLFIVACLVWGSRSNLSVTTQAPANIGGNPVGTQPNNSLFFRPITAGTTLGSVGIAVPPTTVADSATVGNNDTAGVAIDVLANDIAGSVPIDPSSLLVVDEPQFGTTTVDPVTGVITYVPEFGSLEPEDGFTYVVQDVQGRFSNISAVVINVVGLFCYAPCSLTQTIVVDVDPDTLTMQQAGGSVQLDTVVLNGQPQQATATLQPVEVVNERGGTAPWDVTGQLTSDFKTDVAGADCPAATPSSWYWRCVPGDNLGWNPLAAVGHQQVPGDVAVAEPGADLTDGLRSAPRKLCGAPATESGGTFTCGALLSLGVPASAGAGRYAATLTLTLA